MIESLILLVVALIAAIVLGAAALRWFDLQRRRIVVHDYQWGVLYRRGRLQAVVDPGAYTLWRKDSVITLLDKRRQLLSVVGQEVLTRDNVGLKTSITVDFVISDPTATLHKVTNHLTYMHDLIQQAVRQAVGSRTLDELLDARSAIATDIVGTTAEPLRDVGIELQGARLRDIMLAKEIRASYAAALAARKQGEAALERARGETAALRNLSNAARMMRENPDLLPLRLIQLMASPEGAGRTFVVGMPGVAPVGPGAPTPSA
jgi:regulator of protease activity HflC (stomatin/prohibitin superfamily)